MTRLASSLVVAGLIRHAESEGGVGTLLARGDAQAGSILVILNEKGRNQGILERILQADGRYQWQDIFTQDTDNEEQISRFLERRRAFDRDIWLI